MNRNVSQVMLRLEQLQEQTQWRAAAWLIVSSFPVSTKKMSKDREMLRDDNTPHSAQTHQQTQQAVYNSIKFNLGAMGDLKTIGLASGELILPVLS